MPRVDQGRQGVVPRDQLSQPRRLLGASGLLRRSRGPGRNTKAGREDVGDVEAKRPATRSKSCEFGRSTPSCRSSRPQPFAHWSRRFLPKPIHRARSRFGARCSMLSMAATTPSWPRSFSRPMPSLAAELKPRAIELLTERPAWTRPLLAAIEAKQIPASALNVNQLRRLQKSKDPEIASRVKTLFGTIRDRRNPLPRAHGRADEER